MKPDEYDAWYRSPRGKWIGATEYSLLSQHLRAEKGSSIVDIGCGTGHFTRLFAQDVHGPVVGVDPNQEWLSYASAHARHGERYLASTGEALPFPDRAFDYAVSVTALCFARDQREMLSELLRVTRRRFVLGLLNRNSLLYLRKGRRGGSGGYFGAHWHTASEVLTLLEPMPVRNVILRTAVILPQPTCLARGVESRWPEFLLLGGLLAVAGDIVDAAPKLRR